MEAFAPVKEDVLNPSRPKPTLLQKFLLLLRLLGIGITTVSCSLYLHFAHYILQPLLGRSFFRKFADYVQQRWFDAMFFLLLPTKLHLTGDFAHLQTRDHTKTKIIIANHQTDVDWIYLWMLAQTSPQQSQSGHLKVLLKEGVKKIPVFGSFMDKLDFIWIKRNWEEDSQHLQHKLKTLVRDEDSPLWILLFPEGMTVNTRSMEKSQKFAQVQNRVKLNLTLLPRSKGFEGVLSAVNEKDFEVYDLTMAFQGYSGEVPTWDMGYERNRDFHIPTVQKLFFGMKVGDCVMDVRRVTHEVVDGNYTSLETWLDARWERKDELLARFVSHGKLTDQVAHVVLPKGRIAQGTLVFSLQTVALLLGLRFAVKKVMAMKGYS